jgi:hypothetical protein
MIFSHNTDGNSSYYTLRINLFQSAKGKKSDFIELSEMEKNKYMLIPSN